MKKNLEDNLLIGKEENMTIGLYLDLQSSLCVSRPTIKFMDRYIIPTSELHSLMKDAICGIQLNKEYGDVDSEVCNICTYRAYRILLGTDKNEITLTAEQAEESGLTILSDLLKSGNKYASNSVGPDVKIAGEEFTVEEISYYLRFAYDCLSLGFQSENGDYDFAVIAKAARAYALGLGLSGCDRNDVVKGMADGFPMLSNETIDNVISSLESKYY